MKVKETQHPGLCWTVLSAIAGIGVLQAYGILGIFDSKQVWLLSTCMFKMVAHYGGFVSVARLL